MTQLCFLTWFHCVPACSCKLLASAKTELYSGLYDKSVSQENPQLASQRVELPLQRYQKIRFDPPPMYCLIHLSKIFKNL